MFQDKEANLFHKPSSLRRTTINLILISPKLGNLTVSDLTLYISILDNGTLGNPNSGYLFSNLELNMYSCIEVDDTYNVSIYLT